MIVRHGMDLEECAQAFAPVLNSMSHILRCSDWGDDKYRPDLAAWCDAMAGALQEALNARV